MPVPPRVSAVDLFCGVGGLSYGLSQAGIDIAAGVDLDEGCRYPYEQNLHASFHRRDVTTLSARELRAMWPKGTRYRVLAGCAPCQPFSSYRRGADTTAERQWPLVDQMSRLVAATKPHVVTMENVPRIVNTDVFQRFVDTLRDKGYLVDHRSCHCPDYGVPQYRRRRVLLASRIGPITVPTGGLSAGEYRTVRTEIGGLPPIEHGQEHPDDRLHKSRTLGATNLARIRASKPGGTWRDWDDPKLLSPCHTKKSGATFRNVYARMVWDEPAPTITTMAYNFGTGRFGHPEQDRPISLREAAILQSFPPSYEFVPPDQPVQLAPLGRLIGNAVPPRLAEAIGHRILDHVGTRH
ncbi:cytosine-specific methyltransferase [Actinocatenispora thailandica]|uniref:DNA (cytosine-5-)-methyltransferase n=1 Tax=Actinocatenispora thailandica TaxID=227318 RepID=A0A7R7DSX5_9ACTN|nr:DNA cytosine methyltransferase [Actinocatenispora thailandica]BCJ37156.1 cytosine-specific methyltransferase [Actinocatenispora thailandica]